MVHWCQTYRRLVLEERVVCGVCLDKTLVPLNAGLLEEDCLELGVLGVERLCCLAEPMVAWLIIFVLLKELDGTAIQMGLCVGLEDLQYL